MIVHRYYKLAVLALNQVSKDYTFFSFVTIVQNGSGSG
jgi:hypothetical protein